MEGRTRAAMVAIVVTVLLATWAWAGGERESTTDTAASTKLAPFTVLTPLYSPQETKSQFWKGLDELAGGDLNINWVPINGYLDKVRLLLGSGDLPDAVVIRGAMWRDPAVVKAADQGLFYDITPILGDLSKYPNLKRALPPYAWKLTQYGGKNYGIPRTRPQLDGTCIMIRSDWLKKVGRPLPTEVNEYYETVKAIVNSDPDGNGKRDTIGMKPYCFLRAFDFDALEFNAEGGLKRPEFTDKYMRSIALNRKAYADGLYSKEFSVLKDNQYDEMFMSGRLVANSFTAWHAYTYEQEARKVDPKAEVGVIPVLKGEDYTAELFPGYDGAILISRRTPEAKVKQIIAFYERTASEEVGDYAQWGKAGVHYNMVNGVPTKTDLGNKEINNSTMHPLVLPHLKWYKIDSPVAPMDYNEKTRKTMSVQLDIGKPGLFQYILTSDTWTKEWAKVEPQFVANQTKAVTGAITLDEFKSYLNGIEKRPEIQKSFNEFAASYKEYQGLIGK